MWWMTAWALISQPCAAKGGAVPVILEALKQREADCGRLQAELTACAAEPAVTCKPAHVLRAQLRGFLDDWQGLLSGNVAEARPLLDLVLADRIGFTPTADRGYQLTVPVVFDRVLTAAVPDLRGLQDRVASPRGPVTRWNRVFNGFPTWRESVGGDGDVGSLHLRMDGRRFDWFAPGGSRT